MAFNKERPEEPAPGSGLRPARGQAPRASRRRSAPKGRVPKDARLWCLPYEKGIALGAALTGCCAFAGSAAAHGFGQRYDLPLPLSLYLLGTAAAVILSFVVVALFAQHTPGARGYPRIDLGAYPALAALLKLVAVALFILTVTA